MSTKNVNNINKRHIVIFLDNCTRKNIMSWYCKRKPTWRKNLITSLDYVFFKLIGYHLERGEVRLKVDIQGQGVEEFWM